MNDEQQKQRFITVAKWGVGILAAAVIAPIALLALKGILGLAAAATIGIVGINLAPVIATKLSNWKYRALAAEEIEHIEKLSNAAAANPIETLMQQSLEKREASDQFKTAITMFRTEVTNFADQIKVFAKDYPEDVGRFNSQLDAMNKLLKFREDRYSTLQKELKNFDDAIKKAQAMWNMSLAAHKMNELAGMEIGDPFEKIKADSAINSVMTSMNKAFAEMETALLDNKEIQQAQTAHLLENNLNSVPQPVTINQKVSV